MSDCIPNKPDPATERKWAEELRRRIQAVKSGEMKVILEEESDAEVELLLTEDNTGDQPSLLARE